MRLTISLSLRVVIGLVLLGACNQNTRTLPGAVDASRDSLDLAGVGDLAISGGGGCANGAQDGPESDVDCGGSCPPCAAGRRCLVDGDCASMKCRGGLCAGKFALAPERKLAIANNAAGVAAGDLDRDGHVDLVACDYAGVHIVLGHGDGTFGAAKGYPAGDAPIHVAIGDFDGDQKLDLAVTNQMSEDVTLLKGRGDGTFTPLGQTTPVGMSPYDGAVADFNGDGADDVVVANAGDMFVSLLLGGPMGFRATTVRARYSPGVAAADFNGDKKPDIAAAEYGYSDVTLLLGDGRGSFGLGMLFPAGTSPTSVATSDFDGDGKLDLAVANQMSDDLSVLLGDGAGSFEESATIPLSKNPYALAAGDLDGDGKADVVTANRGDWMTEQPGDVRILLSNGDGTFADARIMKLGRYPFGVVLADFNEDHLLDVVIADSGGSSVFLLLNATR